MSECLLEVKAHSTEIEREKQLAYLSSRTAKELLDLKVTDQELVLFFKRLEVVNSNILKLSRFSSL